MLSKSGPIHHNDPVFQHIPVLRNHPLLDDRVIGIVLLPYHEKDPFRVPPCKQGIVGEAPIARHDGSPGKERPCAMVTSWTPHQVLFVFGRIDSI